MVASHARYLEAVVANLSTICHDHEVKVSPLIFRLFPSRLADENLLPWQMTDQDYSDEIDGIFQELDKMTITGS